MKSPKLRPLDDRVVVEPVEAGVCGLWPGLLGFQLVSAAEVRAAR